MSENIYELMLYRDDGSTLPCQLNVTDVSEACFVTFQAESKESNTFEGSDFFEALCSLRDWLNKLDYKLACKGALINTYPSSMMRQMSKGKVAYNTTLGKQAKRKDIVNIFEKTESIDSLATVKEQREFHEQWIRSLQ